MEEGMHEEEESGGQFITNRRFNEFLRQQAHQLLSFNEGKKKYRRRRRHTSKLVATPVPKGQITSESLISSQKVTTVLNGFEFLWIDRG